MKKLVIIAIAIIVCGLSVGYYVYSKKQAIVKNNTATTQRYAKQLKHDAFSLTGTFRWTFFLGPVEQVSTHTFSPSYIDYRMRGKVHSTDYRMQQLSYDDIDKKWIGQSPEGIVYVLFFKDIDNEKLTLYKHKCQQGLPEALAFQRPSNDETHDHGWNIYTREGVAEHGDKLGFGGIFYTSTDQAFELRDHQATWNDKTYDKLTHHFGERRWVGKNGNHYLVIFYDYEQGSSQGRFAVIASDDVKQAYKLKHQQQTFTTYYLK